MKKFVEVKFLGPVKLDSPNCGTTTPNRSKIHEKCFKGEF